VHSSIGQRALRSFVNLDEHTVHAGSHGRARERGNKLRLSAGRIAQTSRNLDRYA